MAKAPESNGMAGIEAYLGALPAEHRAALEELRAIIRKAAPDAEEGIGYGIPAFRYKGRPLVYYGAAKAHAGFYGVSSAVFEAFREELSGYGTSKGTVRFPYGGKLPARLIARIVKARMAETDAKPAKR